MYHGRLPDRENDTPRSGATPLCRRGFMLAAVAFVAGAGSTWVAMRLAGRGAVVDAATEAPGPSAEDPPPAVPPPPRGTLAWALSMIDAADADLLAAAGDLERVSARHRREDGLLPIFERLLDLALRTVSPEVDTAAACAIRSLIRHGRADLALAREDDVASRPELTETARAFERAAGRVEHR